MSETVFWNYASYLTQARLMSPRRTRLTKPGSRGKSA